jgi:Mg-chelatase subunit ChlD
MIILIIAAVFSVDIAYMHMVRSELRTATDAAARAGAETLARTQDSGQAIDAALRIAEFNVVAGNGLTLARGDIVLGNSQPDANGKFQFVAGAEPMTSVHVTGQRISSAPDSTVPLFFAPLLGTTDFQPIQVATASSTVRDIALVLDRSGSMSTPLDGGTRFTALVAAVNVFLTEIQSSSPSSLISLTTYSTTSTRDIPLTDDFARVQSRVRRLRPDGFTNIFEALRQGSDSLVEDARTRPFAHKTIVLMTDGIFNVGGTPIPSANVAASRGHTIHTITFSPEANQATMQQVAAIGNGQHIHADSAADLSQAFRDIARSLSVLLVE